MHGVSRCGHRHRGDDELSWKDNLVKKLLMSVAAIATLASATAASAQPFVPSFGIDAREAAAARRIAWCEATHRMSHAQAAYLRFQLRMIERLEWQLRHGGLTYFEYRVLSARLSRLEAQIRRACSPWFVVVPPRVIERVPHIPGPGPVELEERF
jgi:hypothetical protein